MTLDQLARATGLPIRTLRFYISEGVLPPARGRGRSAEYGEEHLKRLAVIAELKEARLSLGEIRAAVAGTHPDDTWRALSGMWGLAERTEAYSGGLLHAERASSREVTPAARPRSGPREALAYLRRIRGRQAISEEAALSEPSAAPPGTGPPTPRTRREPQASAPASSASEVSAQEISAPEVSAPRVHARHLQIPLADVQRRSFASWRFPKASEPDVWRRVSVTPDVEINYREPLSDAAIEAIARAASALRDRLRSGPPEKEE